MKKLFLTLAVVFTVMGFCAAQNPPISGDADCPYKTAGQRVLLPLPAGQVKPEGWLRDWSEAARDGYTAVMDDVDPEFARAWTADFAPFCPVGDWGNGSWSFEGGGYWFDGLVRLAYQLEDPRLIELAKKRLAPVLENAVPDQIGYFYWLKKDDPAAREAIKVVSGWGLWASGLFGRAMLAYYDATGDERALYAMRCADNSHEIQSITVSGLGCGWSNTVTPCDEYTRSGDPDVAKTLDDFFNRANGANWYDVDGIFHNAPPESLLKGDGFTCENPMQYVWRYHGAVLNETITGFAAGTLWTGRREFLDTVLAWGDYIDRVALQPYGAMVEDELCGPKGAYRCTETCALAAELWRRIQFFSLIGSGRDADKIERLFFNAGAGTVTRDFTEHVYFQQPNRISSDSFLFSWGNSKGGIFQRSHYPLCCTAGVNRIVPLFTQHLWMKSAEGGLTAVLYAPNKLDTELGGKKVSIETVTDYPFEETITMTVHTDTSFPLRLRIPEWCEQPQTELNGQTVDVAADENGFVLLDRAWSDGDTIKLTFPMTVCLEEGIDRNAGELPMPTGAAHGKGIPLGMYADSQMHTVPYADISYGPLLFAYPIPEADENTPQENAFWQYALDPKHVLDHVKVQRQSVPRPWRWQVDSPVKITVDALRGSWEHDESFPALPSPEKISVEKPEPITLVPYGCAKLRVSMFPVTDSEGTKEQ
ncbi:MAG: glycoside hydrolase family 127 protein [Thermoguttaceae bacterium]|nr:glycoside hydrolase family 127 protein [Thermoguttaceae bacterium]